MQNKFWYKVLVRKKRSDGERIWIVALQNQCIGGQTHFICETRHREHAHKVASFVSNLLTIIRLELMLLSEREASSNE